MNDTSSVKSADRVLDLLELLAARPAGVGFAEMSMILAIPKSSLAQLLRNLGRRGYVAKVDSAGTYRLGPQLARLNSQLEAPTLVSIAAPFVENAARQFNETVALYVRHGDQVRAELSVGSTRALRFTLSQGDHAPLYVMSAGRAILAHESGDLVSSYVNGLSPEKFTSHTKTSPIQILEAIEEASSTGFAYSREEYTLGIIGISKAIIVDKAAVGAITFAIPSVRLDAKSEVEVRRVLRVTVSSIENAMNALKHQVMMA